MTPATLLDIELPRTLDAWTADLSKRARPGRVIEGWLFEGARSRRAAERKLRAEGIEARFHCAYKPLVHHFLEQVDISGLARVAVRYPVHPAAPPRRFALEAYPLVELIGAAALTMRPKTVSDAMPAYEVELQWGDGRRRFDIVPAPNRVHVDHLGETLLSPTAWLDGVRCESDCEAVFRHAIDCAQRHRWPEAEPYFDRLDIRIDIPGIAGDTQGEAGWIDLHEALHEDVYFSLLELFHQRSGRPAGDRRLQPGQIVPDVRASDGPVRLRMALASHAPPRSEAALDDASPLAQAAAPLAPARIGREINLIAGHRFEARSVQGRPVHGVYRPGPGPAVMITGAQHANETSGVVGALRAAQALAQRADAHFAVIPLENPDGYALHRELCASAPRHMHHAARYTALGDDLEFRESPPWHERDARRQAMDLSGAALHINLHGYPAHEWTRPMTGYIPRGFESWTLPKGFFLIVRHHSGWALQARTLAEHVCRELARRPALMAFNAAQCASYNAHAGELPFEVIHGTACMISEVNRQGSCALTLITEFPDETIYGDPFVLAHDTQTAAALAAVDAMGLIAPPNP